MASCITENVYLLLLDLHAYCWPFNLKKTNYIIIGHETRSSISVQADYIFGIYGNPSPGALGLLWLVTRWTGGWKREGGVPVCEGRMNMCAQRCEYKEKRSTKLGQKNGTPEQLKPELNKGLPCSIFFFFVWALLFWVRSLMLYENRTMAGEPIY